MNFMKAFTDFKKTIVNLEGQLNEFMQEQYGDDAWLAIDDVRLFNYFDEEDSFISITMNIRGGDESDKNVFQGEFDIPDKLTNLLDYLKGVITSQMAKIS